MQSTGHGVKTLSSATAVPAKEEALAHVDPMSMVDSGTTNYQGLNARYREVLKWRRARVFLYGLAIGSQPCTQNLRENPQALQ